MKRKDRNLTPSMQKIVNRIAKVRRAASLAAENKRRFGEYRYLRAVLRAHAYFADNKLLLGMMEITPSVPLVPVRKGAHPLRVIIDATCMQPDLRMRSRWSAP